MNFNVKYLEKFSENVKKIIPLEKAIDDMADLLSRTKLTGKNVYLIGLGGSSANCSHAVNDFRKLCGLKASTPFDNISEMTARINDDGWNSCICTWLEAQNFGMGDVLLVLSVGGGSIDKEVSIPLVKAISYAREVGACVLSIVGKPDGYAGTHSDVCVCTPHPDSALLTPFAESMQSVILHLLASHPKLKSSPTKWEELE